MTDTVQPASAVAQPLDEISQAYIALAFGLDRHIPGAIDGYMGPDVLRPDLSAPAPEPSLLVTQAEALLTAIERADLPPARVDYLLAQATGMATMCRKLAGEELTYEDEVKHYFDVTPERTPESAYTEAVAALEDALPGTGAIGERMIAWRKQYEISVEAALGIVPAIVDEIRRRTVQFAALPDGEAVELSFVQDKPWSGYNWYLGSNRSLIEINTDLPIKANALLDLMCHEGYPGHHTEHSLKEQVLYRERGYGEHSILMINTPECVISEGIATLAQSVLFQPGEAEEWQASQVLAPLGIATDPVRDRQIAGAQRTMRSVDGNAALLLYADGAAEAEVIDYLARYKFCSVEEATHRLRFLVDPLWRAYVFTYHVGRDLLGAWLDREDEPGESLTAAAQWTRRQERFRSLLEEQVTPSAIVSELAG